MKRLALTLIFVFATAAVVCADCKDPDAEKRDSYFAGSFSEHQVRVQKYLSKVEKGSASIVLLPDASTIEFAPDINYGARLSMVFSEGFGAISVNGKFGFIDSKGTVVIPPQFDFADCFSEGFAAVQVKDKWGFSDRTGKLAVPAKFDFALGFSEGLALVKVGKLWGYIDKTGKFVIEPKFEEARSFSEGLAGVCIYDKDYVWTTHSRPDGKYMWGFIDKNGNWALPLYDGIDNDFSGGMALVSRNIGYNNGVIAESYFIDKKGKELWVLNSSHITWFSDDMIVIRTGRDKDKNRELYSFLDRNGQRPNGKSFHDLSAFSEGLAVACEDERCGFIDKKGEYVIKPGFLEFDSFSEGLAVFYDDDRVGYIDKKGDTVIEPKFDWVGYFSEGKAAVAKDGRLGYIDKTGKYIWKPAK